MLTAWAVWGRFAIAAALVVVLTAGSAHYCSLVDARKRVASLEAVAEVERDAAKTDRAIEREAQRLEVVVANTPPGRELVCNAVFARWVAGVFPNHHSGDTCAPARVPGTAGSTAGK